MTVALDTSAIAAVVFGEPDAEALLAIMTAHAGDLVIGAATLVETAIVVEAKQGADAGADLRALLTTLGVEVAAVGPDHAQLAVQAWLRFGKGHPAALNLGDCFSYATAKAAAAPLLFKGEDFRKTDIAGAA